jgi:hypothetical protein
MWTCAALAFTLAVPGCGDDSASSSDAPADDPETVEAVTKKIEVAAGRIANNTRDRNLPGPYTFKSVCLTPDQARSFGTPRESVQCHVEAFTTPGKGRKPGVAYVWSEDWRVPVQDGQLGEPEIVGEYRIRNFLRKDHRLNCSGGDTPTERCTGVYQTPPEQTGVPGAAPPAP